MQVEILEWNFWLGAEL